MSDEAFKYTTAIRKIRKLSKRKKVIQGGTSAGKTYAIIPILIDLAAKTPKLKITVVAETIPAVKDGAVDIFKQIMQNTGRWIDSHWIGNPLEYTFSNKSRIQFKAFDTEGKAKAAGKRDILFLNEANHIPFVIADALMIRSKQTFIDFNPNNEFWVHEEVLQEPNSEFLLLTYEDNEALPEETLEDILIKKGKAFYDVNAKDLHAKSNIKNNYWANWWKVYGEGQIGALEGVVFDNWKQVANVPEDARLIGIGLDFGYTNDPTAAIDVYKWNEYRVLDQRCYRTGMVNSDIAKALPKNTIVYADSAEPKSIEEIKRMGISIKGVTKGADSINFGIQIMQDQKYLVTERSVDLIDELRNYSWDKDKTGKTLNKPIDAFNHAIDAVRYHEMESIGLKKVTTISKPKPVKGLNFG